MDDRSIWLTSVLRGDVSSVTVQLRDVYILSREQYTREVSSCYITFLICIWEVYQF
jgi:hypothetical protein